MIIGTIIGNVWATRKSDGLNGWKLMIVEPMSIKNNSSQKPIVAADTIGAGIGETVLLVSGSSARVNISSDGKAPIDYAIVGIVDTIDIPEEEHRQKYL